MATLAGLGSRLQKRVKALEAKASRAGQAATLAVLEHLTDETPADTSKAVSNWRVGLGFPSTIVIEPHVPGHFGFTHLRSERIANAIGKAIIRLKKPGEKLFVSNNVDYIRPLDAGTASPKNRNFVRPAVTRGRMAARRVLRSKNG